MVPGVPEGFQSMIDIDILRTDDRIRSRFLNLTRSRFGRDLEEGSPDLTSIAACARRLQVIPQIQSPLSRQVLRPGVPGGGRLLMFPGMHGTIAAFQRLAQFVPESMEVVGWEHLGLDERTEIPSEPRRHRGTRVVEVEIMQGLDLDAPIHVFGFCVGGSIGQAVLRRIAPTGGKLIILDGHPAESIASYSRVAAEHRHRKGVAACVEGWSGRAAIGEDRGPPAVCPRSASRRNGAMRTFHSIAPVHRCPSGRWVRRTGNRMFAVSKRSACLILVTSICFGWARSSESSLHSLRRET